MTEKDDDFPCTCPRVHVTSSFSKLDPVAGECMKHGAKDCPHGEPLHYHHDGCPVCSFEEPDDLEDPLATEKGRQAMAKRFADAVFPPVVERGELMTKEQAVAFVHRMKAKEKRARQGKALVRMARQIAAQRMGSIEASLETDGGALAKGALRLLLTDDKDGAMGMLGAVFMRTLQFDEDGQMKPGKTKVTEEDLVDALKDLIKEPH